MRNALFLFLLLTALLTLGTPGRTLAQVPAGSALATVATGAAQPVSGLAAPDPPRAATVLALAAPTPLPEVADLAAPLPAAYTAPAAAARPTDGLQTTRVVLGIAAAVVALLGAILAVSR